MISAKRLASKVLRTSMRGDRNGLSAFGRLALRFADHLKFHADNLERSWYFDQNPSVPNARWGVSIENKIAYDFGANHGSNIPYYLSLGMRVIAVEANPILARAMQELYAEHPNVIIENACVVQSQSCTPVPFFVHKNDLLSSGILDEKLDDQFEKIHVKGLTPAQIFQLHGAPFFVKIDLEGLDGPIAEAVLRAAPDLPYISAEAHSIEPFCHFVSAGYRYFKFVEAPYLGRKYYNLSARNGHPSFRFSFHDAGPFGEDIPGDWLGLDAAFAYLQRYGIGWKDIHARRDEILTDESDR